MTAAASVSARAPATPATATARRAATRRRRGSTSSTSASTSASGAASARCCCNRDGRDTEDATTLAATYSLASSAPARLTLRAAQLFEPDHELALTALYTMPLGPRRSASVELLKRSGDYGARGMFRQTRGASDLGLDYRLAAEAGTPRQQRSRRGSATSPTMGAADLAVERFDGDNALRAGVNGSVALIDGEVAVSRRIDRAFGLVNLPGFPDVRVYLDNREAGRTDADGRLLLPGLRPYESNRVRLEVDDLPLDAEIDARPRSRRCRSSAAA